MEGAARKRWKKVRKSRWRGKEEGDRRVQLIGPGTSCPASSTLSFIGKSSTAGLCYFLCSSTSSLHSKVFSPSIPLLSSLLHDRPRLVNWKLISIDRFKIPLRLREIVWKRSIRERSNDSEIILIRPHALRDIKMLRCYKYYLSSLFSDLSLFIYSMVLSSKRIEVRDEKNSELCWIVTREI